MKLTTALQTLITIMYDHDGTLSRHTGSWLIHSRKAKTALPNRTQSHVIFQANKLGLIFKEITGCYRLTDEGRRLVRQLKKPAI